MRFLWRWLKRAVLALVLVTLGLLAPVAYVETMCRPAVGADSYRAILPPEHHRPEGRTLLTYPEWHIVHAYDDYAEVIRTGDPHHYAFLPAIGGFWSSLCALSSASGDYGGFPWETKQMVYVIGVSFTAELGLKAAYEETLGRLATLIRGPARANLDEVSAAQAAAYAQFLQQVPWYKWDFRADARQLAVLSLGTPRDTERRLALGLEYRAKAAYAGVIAAAVAGVGADAPTLRIIVTGISPEDAAALSGVSVIGPRPEGLELETPRYRAFTDLARQLAARGAEFVEIAGNDDILFTALSANATLPDALHSFARQGYGDHRHLRLIRVVDLASALRRGDGARVEHVHDY